MKKILIFLLITTLLLSALSKEDKIIRDSLYPYTVKDITYYPHKVSVGETHEVLASWYGDFFHGKKTALGEIYDMYGYTAAHKTYPLGTELLVTNPKNGKSLTVKINDRGPFWNDRELDLSMGAAEYLGTKESGVEKVKIEVLSVPHIVDSLAPIKKRVVNGYVAMSYSTITATTTKVPIEIGNFYKKSKANAYLKKLKKYLPLSYLEENNSQYKIKFFLSAKSNVAKKRLKKLKKLGLISGYGLCWSYDD